ncbi:MAG: phosphoribosylformylglycinamidine cyclo-ligase [Acidaminobacteraceae bacterium]
MQNISRQAYKDAGVNVEEGYRAVELMKAHVSKTFNSNVLTGLGSFGGLFDLSYIIEAGIKKPVLVSGTDGVGTKLKIAFDTGIHDTVGIDLVAMCANDVLCLGAKPLFFLDYLATGKLDANVAASIVKGVSDGCIEAGSALIGGETAEMPGFYAEGEYDLAGFSVGIVDKDKIVDGSSISEGDVIIGLPSSGIHSNGYSLVRNIVFDKMKLDLNYEIEDGVTLGKTLLEPTRIYYKAVSELLENVNVKGMVHVTGGGFYENIPRVLPEGLCATIEKNSWPMPYIFTKLKEWGSLEDEDMFATFNMGVGYIAVVSKEESDKAIECLRAVGEEAYIIGNINKGSGVKI